MRMQARSSISGARALAVVTASLAVVGLVAAPVAADSSTGELIPRAITTSGELLEARSGTYGELFPNGSQMAAATPVLALDIQPQEGASARLLVPGTDDGRIETLPFTLFEPAEEAVDDTLILLWQSLSANDGTRQIRFVSVKRGSGGLEWSEVFSVRDGAGDVLELSQPPQFAITRQDFSRQLEEQAFSAQHTLVHLLWPGGASGTSPIYSSVVWVDGLYVGFNPVFDLTADFLQFRGEGETDAPPALPSGLVSSTHLEVAESGRSLLVTFANQESGRVGNLTIDAVPLAHGVLGDLVRDEVFNHADSFDPGELQPFVDKFRAGVVIIGRNFDYHPAVVEYVTSRVGNWILDQGEDYGFEDFVALGEDARDMTIGLSHSVYASRVADPANPGSTLVELDLSDVLGGDTAANNPGQLLDFQVSADLAAPAIGDGAVTLLPSHDGERLLITWLDAEGQRLHYVTSRQDGSWTPAQSIALRQGLSLEEAHRLLRAKLR